MRHLIILALTTLFIATCVRSQVSPLGIQALGSILGFNRGPGGGFRSPFRPPSLSGIPSGGPPPGFGVPIAAGSYGVPVHSFGPQFSPGGFGSPFGAPASFGSPSFGPNPFMSGGYGSLMPSGSFSSPVSVGGFNVDGFDTSDYGSSVGDYVALGSSSNPFISEFDQSEDASGMQRKDEDEGLSEQ